jgi:hypothetical protein
MSASSSELPEIVRVGRRVVVELLDQDGRREQLTLDVVPDSAADFATGFLGAGAPLAQAIMGRPAGSVVPYAFADIVEVRVLSIAPGGQAPTDAASVRAAATQEAVDRANREESVRLALTVNVKWGGYDPEPLEPPAD